MDNCVNTNLGTLSFLQQLKKNSRMNKHQHFYAADRNQLYNNVFAITAIASNVFLGSLLLLTISETMPDTTKWASASLAILAAACSGIQIFFNFQKVFEEHRRIANGYLEIQRECERLIALYTDGLISKEDFANQVAIVKKEYDRTTNRAESFPTHDYDFKKAVEYERKFVTEANTPT